MKKFNPAMWTAAFIVAVGASCMAFAPSASAEIIHLYEKTNIPNGYSAEDVANFEQSSRMRVDHKNAVLVLDQQDGEFNNNIKRTYNIESRADGLVLDNMIYIDQEEATAANRIEQNFNIEADNATVFVLKNTLTIIQTLGNYLNEITQNFIVTSKRLYDVLLFNIAQVSQSATAAVSNMFKQNVIFKSEAGSSFNPKMEKFDNAPYPNVAGTELSLSYQTLPSKSYFEKITWKVQSLLGELRSRFGRR